MKEQERINEIEKLLVKGHNLRISSKCIKVFGYQFDYYTDLYGDLNLYWFGEHKVNEMIAPLNSDSNNNNNRPGTIKEKTLYICIHDTASSAETANAYAHAKYVSNGGGGTSWHYSCGDDAIYHQIPDNEVAYHAGDGTAIKLAYVDTNVKATVKYPIIEVIDGYYYLNGKKTIVKVPDVSYLLNDRGELVYSSCGVLQNKKAPNGSKEGIANLVLTTDMINDQELKVVIGENGNYFMLPTYYSSTYGYIANRCGNLYSIGIETMVNKGSNLLLTWHRCAKLVAHLLLNNNLSVEDVKPHHYFSGKPCPMTLRYNKLWNYFIEMVNIEFNILKLIDETTEIKLISKDSKDGVLIRKPDFKNIEYSVEIKVGKLKKLINFKSNYDC